MIGADEITVYDIHWNSVFVSSKIESIEKYLEAIKSLGFTVVEKQIQSTKHDIQIAVCSIAGRKALGLTFDWKQKRVVDSFGESIGPVYSSCWLDLRQEYKNSLKA